MPPIASISTPTIHLNGTARADLEAQNRHAVRVLEAALGALRQAAPHPRDYYPQGAAAFKPALDQHLARLARIQDTINELNHIRRVICDA